MLDFLRFHKGCSRCLTSWLSRCLTTWNLCQGAETVFGREGIPGRNFPLFFAVAILQWYVVVRKCVISVQIGPRFATVSISTSSTSIKCNIDIFCFWFLCCHLYTQAHSEHQEEISKFWDPRFSYHQNNKFQGVQWKKGWLVVWYKGLYYPVIWGL